MNNTNMLTIDALRDYVRQELLNDSELSIEYDDDLLLVKDLTVILRDCGTDTVEQLSATFVPQLHALVEGHRDGHRASRRRVAGCPRRG